MEKVEKYANIFGVIWGIITHNMDQKIFCLPSKREGFGNTVIESSACEVPVVGSDIFGLQSSLINELNGLTFEVNNVDDLTKKLSMLLNDENLCKKLGKIGREYVLKNFRKKSCQI